MKPRATPTTPLSSIAPLLIPLALCGCSGNLSTPTGGAATAAPAATQPASEAAAPQPEAAAPLTDPLHPDRACEPPASLPRQVRTLNGVQYRSTLASVFGDVPELDDPFSASDRSAEFSTSSALRRFDFNTTQKIRENGRALAEDLTRRLGERLPCLAASADAACAAEVINALGPQLYRRPVDAAHQTKLLGLYERAGATAEPQQALALVVRAMLSSPRFLFRKELGQPTQTPGEYALSSHEVASAVSYTLTNAPPDAELRAAADADALRDPAQVRQQAERLLAAGSATRRGLATFLTEFLGVQDFSVMEKDRELFPDYDDEARGQLWADFAQTMDTTLASTTPTFGELLTGSNYIVRPRSAEILGFADASGFAATGTPTEIPQPERMGLLTHPVVMSSYAHADETNPVARGHFISGKLLCIEVPPPPEAVMFPIRADDDVPRTLRQVLEKQHSVKGCAACHQLMDPLGYPFEVFDAIGRLRTTDNGLPIDTSGSIIASEEIDGPVANVQELLTKVSSSTRAQACFTQRAFKYVTGSGDSDELGCTSAGFARAFLDGGGDVRELFVQLLQSEQFLRRSEAPTAAP